MELSQVRKLSFSLSFLNTSVIVADSQTSEMSSGAGEIPRVRVLEGNGLAQTGWAERDGGGGLGRADGER